MIFHTLVRDCLYVNWALPRAALPPLPEGLTYEAHGDLASPQVFASLVCFRQEELHHEVAPFLKIAYPQCNLRLYVRDREGIPGVFFLRMLVPAWVVPGARFLGRQPVSAAVLEFPPAGLSPPAGPWRWTVAAEGRVALTATAGAGAPGPGPDLGSWQRTVAYFRERPRGFGVRSGKLRSVEAIHPAVEHVPVRLEVEESDLLSSVLPELSPEVWARPHSAFLYPRVPFVFDLRTAPQGVLAGHLLVPG